MTIRLKSGVKRLSSFVTKVSILLHYQVTNLFWKSVPSMPPLTQVPSESNLSMVASSIGLRGLDTNTLQGLNIRHETEDTSINTRVNLKLMSTNLNGDQFRGFYEIINGMASKYQEAGKAIPFHVGQLLGAPRLMIDTYGAPVQSLSVIADFIFEASIRHDITFDTSAVFDLYIVGENRFVSTDRRNMVVKFDYVNHTYAVYDVDTLLSTVEKEKKELA